jgi:hypothetical protein
MSTCLVARKCNAVLICTPGAKGKNPPRADVQNFEAAAAGIARVTPPDPPVADYAAVSVQ